MRVEIKTVLGDYMPESKEARPTKPCCDDMRAALDDYDHFVSVLPDGQPVVAIQVTHCYPEGANTNYKAIAYCPWCATPIVIDEVARVRRVPRKVLSVETRTEYDEAPETPLGVLPTQQTDPTGGEA